MRPIEGVNLQEAVKQAEAERLAELGKQVRAKIGVLLGKIADEHAGLRNLENQKKKAEERLQKLLTNIDALNKGDWNQLQDKQDQNQKDGYQNKEEEK